MSASSVPSLRPNGETRVGNGGTFSAPAGAWASSDVALRNLHDMLVMERKRYVVFFNPDDREVVTAACRQLRDEGYEIAEREHRYVPEGKAICMDADMLQPSWPLVEFR